MRTLLLALCGTGIGVGIALAYSARHPAPAQDREVRTDRRPVSLRRILLALACAGIACGVTRWASMIPIAFAAAYFLPAMLGRDVRGERELAVVEAVASFTEMLRDTLQAAAGLNQALTVTCRHAPSALQPAAAQLAERIEAREGTTREALHAFADTVEDPTADLVALALAAASEHPARDLVALLTSLAATAREQAAMRTRTAVAQARTRTATRMITAITLGLAVLLALIDHAYLAAYDSVTGQLILLWIAGIFALGLRWLHTLGRIQRPERLWGERIEAKP